MRKVIALVFLVVIATPAFAWNDKGHMVVARLAWRQLTDKQRDQVIAILKKHPHYEEFLAAKKPDGFSEDEWVFMRAATWADWVRSHHADEYNHGPSPPAWRRFRREATPRRRFTQRLLYTA